MEKKGSGKSGKLDTLAKSLKQNLMRRKEALQGPRRPLTPAIKRDSEGERGGPSAYLPGRE